MTAFCCGKKQQKKVPVIFERFNRHCAHDMRLRSNGAGFHSTAFGATPARAVFVALRILGIETMQSALRQVQALFGGMVFGAGFMYTAIFFMGMVL